MLFFGWVDRLRLDRDEEDGADLIHVESHRLCAIFSSGVGVERWVLEVLELEAISEE